MLILNLGIIPAVITSEVILRASLCVTTALYILGHTDRYGTLRLRVAIY